MNVDITELKSHLIEAIEKTKETSKHIGPNKVGQAFVNARIGVLGELIMFLHNAEKTGAIDMEKMKQELVVKVVSMADIPGRTRKSELQEKLISYIDNLDHLVKEWERMPEYKKKDTPKPALKLEGISYNHASNTLMDMRKTGKIDNSYKLVKRKIDENNDLIFLVKK